MCNGWSGSSSGDPSQKTNASTIEMGYRPVNLWWYVMFLALLVVLAETAFANGYLGTPREEI